MFVWIGLWIRCEDIVLQALRFRPRKNAWPLQPAHLKRVKGLGRLVDRTLCGAWGGVGARGVVDFKASKG